MIQATKEQEVQKRDYLNIAQHAGNVLPFMLQCHKMLQKCLAVKDSSTVHADPVHLIYVLLGLNLANGQPKVMFGCFGTVETPD